MKLLKSKKGFTLIELLVVIGILAVLVAIAIPSVVGLIDRANVSSDEVNANEMTNAIERFASEYELYCQDIASGALDPNNLDGAQGRVHQVTNVTTRDGIDGIEVDTEEEVDEDIIQVFRDTKYPANAKTAKEIILVYTKISGTPFMPKQSDMHFWYHPASGVVIYAEPDSSVADKNKQLQNGVDAKGDPLTDDEVWYDLSLDYTDEEGEAATTLEYYLTLEGAIADANKDTIGKNADADASNGKVALYKDNSGATCAKLLSDINVFETIFVERDVIILLDGKTVTAKDFETNSNMAVFRNGAVGGTLTMRGNGGTISASSTKGLGLACFVNDTGGKLVIENTNISVNVVNPNSNPVRTYGVYGTDNISAAETTIALTNCNIDVRGGTDFATGVGVGKKNKVEITNCNISAWANMTLNTQIIGVLVSGGAAEADASILNIRNSNVEAANTGVSCGGTHVTIDGGTYKGNQHGGVYLIGQNNRFLVKNANFAWTKMLYGYTNGFNSGYGNTSGAYFGCDGTLDTTVYVDNCHFTGYYYAFRLNSDSKNRTAKVYISNSTAEVLNSAKEEKIVVNRYNELYIGKGNNFDSSWFTSGTTRVIQEVPDGVYNQIP